MRTPLYLAVAAALLLGVVPAAQTDLDAFMQRVLTRRDENWTKLQQYTLEEDERFQVAALDGRKMYGFRREYLWFPDEGVFMRSPVRIDGVELSDDERREAEARWRKREEREEKGTPNSQGEAGANSQGEAGANSQGEAGANSQGGNGGAEPDPDAVPALEDIVKSGNEPRFVSSAYFMKFRFDPGHYALAGREQLMGREVYRIEYYPSRLFSEGRTRPNRELRRRDDRIQEKMNKVALVELWIDPKEHQILQYEFSNIDFDFMPARGLVRLDDLRASMRMGEPFPGVWLPDTIAMRFRMTLAVADVAASYDVRYHRYKLAEVKARMR